MSNEEIEKKALELYPSGNADCAVSDSRHLLRESFIASANLLREQLAKWEQKYNLALASDVYYSQQLQKTKLLEDDLAKKDREIEERIAFANKMLEEVKKGQKLFQKYVKYNEAELAKRDAVIAQYKEVSGQLYQALKIWAPFTQQVSTGDSLLDRTIKATRAYEKLNN